jgi:hypothetical protein
MAVCNFVESKVIDNTVAKAVGLKSLIEANKLQPSVLTLMSNTQKYLSGFISIDNLATRFPALRPYVQALKYGEELRARMGHQYQPIMRKIAALDSKDSRAMMRIFEVENAEEKLADENPDGSASIVATEDHIGSKTGEIVTLPKKLNDLRKEVRAVLNDIYDNVITAVKASYGYPPNMSLQDIENIQEQGRNPEETKALSDRHKAAAAVIRSIENARRMGYFPQVRRGAWAVEFYDANDVKHIEAYDSVLSEGMGALDRFSSLKSSKAKAEARMAELKKQGISIVRLRDLQAEKELYDLYLPSANEMDRIDVLFQAIMTPDKKDALGSIDEVLRRMRVEAEKRKQPRLRRRMNVPGWLRPDNYDTYFRSTFAPFSYQMTDWIANKATEGVRRSAIARIQDKKLQAIAEKQEQYLHSNEAMVAKLKSVAFLYTLGGNLSSALVNLTQMMHTALPFLAGVGGTGNAAKELSLAFTQVLDSIKLTLKPEELLNVDKMRGLSADEKEMIKELFRSGVAEALLTRDQAPALLAQSQLESMYGLGMKMGKVLEAFSLPFTMAEQVNRLATGLAAYRLAKNEKAFQRIQKFAKNVGETVEDRVDAAKFAISETQFAMSKPFRAQYMHGLIPGLAFQFATFPFKMLGFIRRAAEYYGGKGLMSTDEGKKVVGLTLLGIFMTAGIWGLPFATPAGDLIDKLMKLVGPSLGLTPTALQAQLRETMRDLFKEVPALNFMGTPAELADYVLNGPFRAVGVDISKRTALDLNLSNMASLDIMNMGPLMGAVVGGAEEAYKYQQKGMPLMAAASLLPVAFRNLARAATMRELGYVTPGKMEPVLPAKELQGNLDFVKVATGFTPTKIAEAREAKEETKDLGTRLDSLRKSYSDKIATNMARAMSTGDPSYRVEAQRLRREIAAHDRGRPLRDRIVPDFESFNTGIQKKVLEFRKPQRIEDVPKTVRPDYTRRLQELKESS